MTNQTIFNAVQAAELLGTTSRTVLRRIKAGEIAATKIGPGRTSAYVIDADEIERVKAARADA